MKNRELEEKEEEIHEMATVSHEKKQKEEKRKIATEITPITYTGKSEFILIKKTFAKERKESYLQYTGRPRRPAMSMEDLGRWKNYKP